METLPFFNKHMNFGHVLNYAARCHDGQFRADKKTPYIVHPIRVACRIIEWGFHAYQDIITAALCHDILEDTDVTRLELEEIIGPSVTLVDELTKTDDSTYEEYIKRLSTDAWIIKLADCYENYIDSKLTWGYANQKTIQKIKWILDNRPTNPGGVVGATIDFLQDVINKKYKEKK